MSGIPCTWCGKPAARRYPGRLLSGVLPDRVVCVRPSVVRFLAPDFYACPDCDALVRAGKPLPGGVATFSVAVKGDG